MCNMRACAQEFGKGLERQCESCGVSARMHVLEKNVKNATDPHDRAERLGLRARARLFPPRGQKKGTTNLYLPCCFHAECQRKCHTSGVNGTAHVRPLMSCSESTHFVA